MAASHIGRPTTAGAAEQQWAPGIGQRVPEFFVDTPDGRLSIGELAARVGKLALVSMDSYRYHPG